MFQSKYKASFAGCSEEDKKQFQYSHCCLPISVGQAYHEGDKFKATLNLVSTHFNKVTIIVADTLQRHNYFLETKNYEQAYIQARQAGSEWLERNLFFIKSLPIETQVLRWEQWLNAPEYQFYYYELVDALIMNECFRHSFQTTRNEYHHRLIKSNALDHETIKKRLLLSNEYLLEECAILIMWAQNQTKYDYLLYPKKLTNVLAATKEIFINKDFENMLNSIFLRFYKVKSGLIQKEEKYVYG